MYIPIYYGYARVCTVRVFCGLYMFSSSVLVFFLFFFLSDDCFVCKSLQFSLLIVNSYKSVNWHLRLREIFRLLNMEQIVTNILAASAVGRKPALEQKLLDLKNFRCCCAHSSFLPACFNPLLISQKTALTSLA